MTRDLLDTDIPSEVIKGKNQAFAAKIPHTSRFTNG